MTKADIVNEISKNTGIDKATVLAMLKPMETVKNSLAENENVYLRGFGSFIVKHRAQNSSQYFKNTTMVIPAHNIPAFKPSKSFVNMVKQK